MTYNVEHFCRRVEYQCKLRVLFDGIQIKCFFICHRKPEFIFGYFVEIILEEFYFKESQGEIASDPQIAASL